MIKIIYFLRFLPMRKNRLPGQLVWTLIVKSKMEDKWVVVTKANKLLS